MASLSLFNRDQQRTPQRSGADAYQFVCHECDKPKSVVTRYGHSPLIRCITPGCAQTTFNPIDRQQTTWTACRFI